MSLKIEQEVSFSEGLKSKIMEQSSKAIRLIESESENEPHYVIHEVRKCFKKIRATLRLVRDHIDFYKVENVFFRDQGRRISDIRDATSVIEGLDLLYEKYADQLYNKTFNHFRNFLLDRRAQLLSQPPDSINVLNAIANDVSEKRTEIKAWSFSIENFKTIYPSVSRVYKRGRHAYQKVSETHHPDDFHEWRKRVKYLRYQLDLLNRTWPDLLSTWENELHKLSDYLGDDRDLLMLAEVADQNQQEFAQPTSYQLLQSLIKSHREKLQYAALLLGQRTYHLGSDAFTSLLQSAWEAYDKQTPIQESTS